MSNISLMKVEIKYLEQQIGELREELNDLRSECHQRLVVDPWSNGNIDLSEALRKTLEYLGLEFVAQSPIKLQKKE